MAVEIITISRQPIRLFAGPPGNVIVKKGDELEWVPDARVGSEETLFISFPAGSPGDDTKVKQRVKMEAKNGGLFPYDVTLEKPGGREETNPHGGTVEVDPKD